MIRFRPAAVERALFAVVESPPGFPTFYEPDIRSAKVERFPTASSTS